MSDNDTTQGFIDETDVEGHRSLSKDDGARQRDEAGPDGARRLPAVDGSDDVEGHRRLSKDDGARQRDEAGPEGARHVLMLDGSDDDVEGHRLMSRDAGPDGLRTGPSTQGEIVRRAPGDNPHGD